MSNNNIPIIHNHHPTKKVQHSTMASSKESAISIHDIVWAVHFGDITSPLNSPFWTALDQLWRFTREQREDILFFLNNCYNAASVENRETVRTLKKIVLSKIKTSAES